MIALHSTSHAQELRWAYSYQQAASVQDAVYGIASDGDNRFCIIGAGIANVPMDVISQSSEFDSPESFIAVYDSEARIQWMHPTAQPNGFTQTAFTVWMDEMANVYVGGRIGTPVDFDPGPEDRTVSNEGGIISYVQKFSDDGEFEWVALAPGGGIVRRIAMFSDGNILFGGEKRQEGAVSYDGGESHSAGAGIFLVEAAPDGRTLGAYVIGGTAQNIDLRDIEVDHDDNIIVCGSFEGTLDFDVDNGETAVTSLASIDAFVAKYDRNFQLLWQRRFGDQPSSNPPSWDIAAAIEVDVNNNIYIAGEFRWTTDFDPDHNPGQWLREADDRAPSPDGFILQYDPDGNIQWIRQLGGEATTPGHNNDVTVSDIELIDGALFVSGALTGTGDFDPSDAEFVLDTGPGGIGTMYFAHFAADGEFRNAFIVDRAASMETALGIEAIARNNIVATGRIQKDVDFDPGPDENLLGTDPEGNLYNLDNDIFIARFDYGESTPSAVDASVQSAQQVDLFPNPATSGVKIDFGSTNVNAIAVYHSSGRLLFRQCVTPAETAWLDMGQFESGLYFIRGQAENSTFVTRLILRK